MAPLIPWIRRVKLGKSHIHELNQQNCVFVDFLAIQITDRTQVDESCPASTFVSTYLDWLREGGFLHLSEVYIAEIKINTYTVQYRVFLT